MWTGDHGIVIEAGRSGADRPFEETQVITARCMAGTMSQKCGASEGPTRMTETTSAWLIDRLLDWYDANARKLPWRAPAGAPASAYGVLVSEFMLQQTTVATVTGRFPAFLARFPDFQALAAADASEVLHAWQGLGYYRRARALHACARAIVQRHGGAAAER